jgi:hypothetical protein
MCYYCQEITSVSRECDDLLIEYQNFQKCSMQTSQLLIAAKTLINSRNTQAFYLYTQAVEAHITAINSFIQLVVFYEKLVHKYLNNSHS